VVIDDDDVRMNDGGGASGFVQEPTDLLLVEKGIGREHFDRRGAIERNLVREPYNAERSAPQLPQGPEPLAALRRKDRPLHLQ